ncbi:thiamine pyrophosphate-binding protein [Anaerovibrio sp.]|uniref:thiamine pyrophosphate-binding protein n=1 Tax=Anaerovibrio sp. TaxID=1872532 RepID=UPI00388E1698
MKVSDYIVQFLIDKGITDLWGYPGGSVTNLTDSLYKRRGEINAHVVYHEQAAGFAACAYANRNGIPGVAYSTGGPGATNLMTTIGHAYYDSIPVVFMTGNVNTYEAKGDMRIRQRGFQESDIISVAAPLTKASMYVESPEKIKYYLQKAFCLATTGRPGPVLIDLPMDVLRADVDVEKLDGYSIAALDKSAKASEEFEACIKDAIKKANFPCLLLGNALKKSQLKEKVRQVVEHFRMPYVTSMIAFDVIEHNEYYCGFAGAYGVRAANIILSKSDLVISLGSRIDQRQSGAVRENFAQDAEIIRVDIDDGELSYKVHENEHSFCMDVEQALDILLNVDSNKCYKSWIEKCALIKEKLQDIDTALPTECIRELSKYIPENAMVTTDVGQNMVWVPQAFKVKKGQKFMFSGGMGAMGHALPASIGACYPLDGRIAVCICGDGGIQMNIQELQYLSREQLPVKIIVMNNYALGMIRHFQEMYFDNVYFQTTAAGGYTVPDFVKVAEAYGIRGRVVTDVSQFRALEKELNDNAPLLIEVRINGDTYVKPKLEYGKPNYDQQPLLDRGLLKELMEL